MKCPHCAVTCHSDPKQAFVGTDKDGAWAACHEVCPSCKRLIVTLVCGLLKRGPEGNFVQTPIKTAVLVYPKGSTRPPCPPQVPTDLSEDYKESCIVLIDSPKASASLSRRCLQHLLRDYAKVRKTDLYNEIQELLDRNVLPTHLATSIDCIRNIGNFAAHPMKSTQSGEILPVEPGEAEWNLDVLEALFDYYFVQPDLIQKKKDALNVKLKDAGKPTMK